MAQPSNVLGLGVGEGGGGAGAGGRDWYTGSWAGRQDLCPAGDVGCWSGWGMCVGGKVEEGKENITTTHNVGLLVLLMEIDRYVNVVDVGTRIKERGYIHSRL